MTAMEILLAALRGQPADHASEASTEQALHLAEAHHVLPMVLAGLPQAVAPAQRSQVRLHGFWWACELKGVIEAFHTAGIAMMPLKGPAFAARAYGAAHLRQCRDLDVLVRPADGAAAEALLHSLGFQPVDDADDYHRPWARGATALELHHGLAVPHSFRFDLDRAWINAERGRFEGSEILHFSAQDELIYLCLHAVRHRFERLSLVLDLDRALERCGGRVTPQTMALAEQQGLGGAMAVGCGLVDRLRDKPAGGSFAPLVDEIWQRLTAGPPVPFTTPELYRFYLRLEPGFTARMRRRLNHLRIAASRLIADDFAFASRLGVDGRHTGTVRALRLVRLMLRYGRRR